MAKGTKNSGFYKQDAVMAKMSADARKPQEVNAIVRQAMEQAERNRIYRAEQEAKAKLNPRFIR
jgi:16S rRNA U1498 N3-methylase RsmE